MRGQSLVIIFEPNTAPNLMPALFKRHLLKKQNLHKIQDEFSNRIAVSIL